MATEALAGLADERPGLLSDAERLLTVGQLADLLGVHANYVYELAARHELPSFKIGGLRRFRRAEVAVWLESKRSRPADGGR